MRQRAKESPRLLQVKCLVILDTIIVCRDFNAIYNVLNKTKLKKKTQRNKEPFQLLVESNVNRTAQQRQFSTLKRKVVVVIFYF